MGVPVFSLQCPTKENMSWFFCLSGLAALQRLLCLQIKNLKLETIIFHVNLRWLFPPPGSRLEKRPCQWLLDQSMKAQQRVRIEYHGLLHSRPMCALGWVLAISSPFIQSHFYSGRFLSNHITHSFVSHDFIFGKNYNTMYISLNFDFLKILEI